jgi:hypothetical protein
MTLLTDDVDPIDMTAAPLDEADPSAWSARPQEVSRNCELGRRYLAQQRLDANVVALARRPGHSASDSSTTTE